MLELNNSIRLVVGLFRFLNKNQTSLKKVLSQYHSVFVCLEVSCEINTLKKEYLIDEQLLSLLGGVL
ncbi:hypothetical protein BpHYR1_026002 [Brachionus plicatilis]|uniref:Uncharacterized protein n=1 Tax=Brachionus plicatilis TaxID=10195 RepID=A0A3M7SS77_BRAPC|nr:hypothetical protein BpHYR1_026002 [Brachionus plicatilis]